MEQRNDIEITARMKLDGGFDLLIDSYNSSDSITIISSIPSVLRHYPFSSICIGKLEAQEIIYFLEEQIKRIESKEVEQDDRS